jgi:hypothetical protein
MSLRRKSEESRSQVVNGHQDFPPLRFGEHAFFFLLDSSANLFLQSSDT